MRATIGAVFRYAIANGTAEVDPTYALRNALIRPTVTPRAAITDLKALGGPMRAIDAFHGQTTTRIALQLLAIVAQRPGELRFATWPEFHLKSAVWSISAERMKMRRPHRVPLPEQAIGLMDELRVITGSGHVLFPSLVSVARPISENTHNTALRCMGISADEMTSHGFRATFSTLANESGLWNPDAIERALAHVEANQVATWKKPERSPILGSRYLAKLSALEAKRKNLVDAVAFTLSAQTTEDLKSCYDEQGDATDSEVRRIQAGPGNPEILANYGHWSATPFFKLVDAVLLSSGLEPSEELEPLISTKPEPEVAVESIYRFLRGRWALLTRQFDPNDLGARIDPRALLGCIEAEVFDAHPDFVRMLRVMVARRGDPNATQSKGEMTHFTGERSPDPRELAALSKLLLAIAITEYGYVPDAARSPIPKQIQDLMDELGVEMSVSVVNRPGFAGDLQPD